MDNLYYEVTLMNERCRKLQFLTTATYVELKQYAKEAEKLQMFKVPYKGKYLTKRSLQRYLIAKLYNDYIQPEMVNLSATGAQTQGRLFVDIEDIAEYGSCPYCGGHVIKVAGKYCGHCRNEIRWQPNFKCVIREAEKKKQMNTYFGRMKKHGIQ